MVVDLRSDTITSPSAAMRQAMCNALVGDDCYRDDPTVQKLEEYTASLLGFESALFMPTGTMSNQVALRVHTRPGDEVITETRYHVSYFESAQTAALAGLVLHTCLTDDGVIRVKDITRMIDAKPRSQNYAQVRLVAVENSIAACEGKVFPLKELQRIKEFAEKNNISVHLDGARLFNAVAAAGTKIGDYKSVADTASVCFAKGLGAPAGAALLGSRGFIEEARRFRKWYGGALHQSGILAAAGLYALENNIPRLPEDHSNAQLLASLLEDAGQYRVINPNPETNFVFFSIEGTSLTSEEFVVLAGKRGVLLFPWTGGMVRAITHLDVTPDGVRKAAQTLGELGSMLGLKAQTGIESSYDRSPRYVPWDPAQDRSEKEFALSR